MKLAPRSHAVRAAIVPRSSALRAAITNRSRLHAKGIDGRSAAARRFRDLVESFADGFGGLDVLPESEVALVRQAAAVILRAEQLQAGIVRGELVDPDELIRLSGAARRLLSAIPKRAAVHKPSANKTLSDFLRLRETVAS